MGYMQWNYFRGKKLENIVLLSAKGLAFQDHGYQTALVLNTY